jgi:multidrug resistance efflux pump
VLAVIRRDNAEFAVSAAGIAIQKAQENKAKVMADIARKNIENMTLKAKTGGYVNVQQNTNQNSVYWGQQFPPFQLGDTTRAGMAVAQIPDLKSWEVSASVGELDRGHLTVGQTVAIRVVALAGKEFAGKVKSIGGTSGPPWDRHFECRITLDKPAPELRPGMTSNMVITVDTLENVLWIPSQALFESDGRTFVYSRGPNGFMPHDVKLVQRSESQAVITGINEGDLIAMSNPDQMNKATGPQDNSAMKAISK